MNCGTLLFSKQFNEEFGNVFDHWFYYPMQDADSEIHFGFPGSLDKLQKNLKFANDLMEVSKIRISPYKKLTKNDFFSNQVHSDDTNIKVKCVLSNKRHAHFVFDQSIEHAQCNLKELLKYLTRLGSLPNYPQVFFRTFIPEEEEQFSVVVLYKKEFMSVGFKVEGKSNTFGMFDNAAITPLVLEENEVLWGILKKLDIVLKANDFAGVLNLSFVIKNGEYLLDDIELFADDLVVGYILYCLRSLSFTDTFIETISRRSGFEKSLITAECFKYLVVERLTLPPYPVVWFPWAEEEGEEAVRNSMFPSFKIRLNVDGASTLITNYIDNGSGVYTFSPLVGMVFSEPDSDSCPGVVEPSMLLSHHKLNSPSSKTVIEYVN